ncbi:MAG: 2-C-methyl-D-erythritol 4-phosphate cytidylyltransferase [Muribaculum sp.]|nr:2-C-methyl-D-erythritol 4-phosphate cytidylyltransferase [Muribaculum sp.]
MKNEKRCTAIVLAAGSGSRMNSAVAKQYMDLAGRPVLWYALQAMERSSVIDDCILVVSDDADVAYAREEIVQKYEFSKVDAIITGGEERYLSVMNALEVIHRGEMKIPNRDGFVFIHDGARPFVSEQILRRLGDAVEQFHACAAAVPAKDTVKLADDEGFALQTPDRKCVWNVQTPQAFDTQLILEAYERLHGRLEKMREQGIVVTDDAGVVELFTDRRVRMVEGSYRNIKITTPEDMIIARAFLKDYLSRYMSQKGTA